MLATLVDNLRRTKAEFARDTEYLKESVLEEEVDDCMEIAESLYFSETAEEVKEAAEWADRIKVDTAEDLKNDEEEIERILESTEDITFDEMINLDEITVL